MTARIIAMLRASAIRLSSTVLINENPPNKAIVAKVERSNGEVRLSDIWAAGTACTRLINKWPKGDREFDTKTADRPSQSDKQSSHKAI